MNRSAYELANKIKTAPLDECSGQMESLKEEEKVKYKKAVLEGIRKEKDIEMEMSSEINKEIKMDESGYERKGCRISWLTTAAACAAAMILGLTVFEKEVHAVIQHISWGIGSALGISDSLEEYRNVVNIPVADNGYIITLQEVVAAEEKLVVNYTLQREDGNPMEQITIPFGGFWVNGKEAMCASSGSGEFLDEKHTIIGITMSYDILGVDMSKENTYQIKFSEIGTEKVVRGKWNFQFTADGIDLIADTRRISVQKEFAIGDTVTVTLEELAINDLEQRVSYHVEGEEPYILMLMAEDDAGNKVQFDTKTFQGNKGYMQNQEFLYDGRLDKNAGSVNMTLFAAKMPKESGRFQEEYQQVGEPFEVKLD